jgi:cell wall-associated NlpC family hydrolase
MAYRTDGSSALKDDILNESTNNDVLKPDAEIVDFNEYKKDKSVDIVDEKIIDISQKVTKNFNGNKKLEEEIKSEIRSIINEEEIKTSREEIDDLAKIISKNLNVENNSEVKIEAKKVRIEIDKWKEKNIEKVIDFRKKEFKNRFEKEVKKLNPNLTTEELTGAKECSELISELYFDESIIENEKNEALESNGKQFSPGQLENSWTDLKGLTNFLKKTPGEIKEIKEKYSSIKNGLKNIKLPNNLKEVRSFDKVVSLFNDQGTNKLFNKTQKYLGWLDKADKFTGGGISRMVIGGGQKLVGKIGNQAIAGFAKNSLNVLAKEGFQKGTAAILKGVLSGGVKAAATSTATGAAAAAGGVAATAATGGMAALAIVAMKAIKKIKEVASKIAEKLGIDTKKFFEENFGKVGGKILNGIVSLVALPAVLIGAVSAVAILPILIGIFVVLFIYQMSQGSLISSLVPPKGTSGYTEISDTNVYSQITISDLDGIKKEINYIYDSEGNLNLSFTEELPEFRTSKRSDILKVSRAVLGLPYYWGGGHGNMGYSEPVKGIDQNWGKTVVSDVAFGSKVEGRNLYGLDCSGFVAWVYYQVTGVNILNGATKIYKNSKHISEEELLPGDIAIQCVDGCNGDKTRNHIGIYLGIGIDGQKYFIHSGGSSTKAGPQNLGGVVISTWPFEAFGRIKQSSINLINDL